MVAKTKPKETAKKKVEAKVQIELKNGSYDLIFDYEAIERVETENDTSFIGYVESVLDVGEKDGVMQYPRFRDILYLVTVGLSHTGKTDDEIKKNIVASNLMKYIEVITVGLGELMSH